MAVKGPNFQLNNRLLFKCFSCDSIAKTITLLILGQSSCKIVQSKACDKSSNLVYLSADGKIITDRLSNASEVY